MIVPVVIGSLVGTGLLYRQYQKKHKGISEERKKIFENALKKMKDPAKLRDLADAFQKEGLRHEAGILRKRANVLSASDEKKAERREIMRKALSSKDPEKVKKVAAAFQEMGYYSAAETLRGYARNLGIKSKSAKVAGEPDFENGVVFDDFAQEFDFSQPADGGEFKTGESFQEQADNPQEIETEGREMVESNQVPEDE